MPGGRPLKEDGDISPQINDKRPDIIGIQNPAYRPAAFFCKQGSDGDVYNISAIFVTRMFFNNR